MLRYATYIVLTVVSIDAGRHAAIGDIAPYCYVAGMSCLALAVYYWKLPILKKFLILAALAAIIAGRANQTLPPNEFNPQQYTDQKVKILAIVSDEPRKGLGWTQVILSDIEFVDNSEINWYGKMTMNTPHYSEINYGDVVEVAGVFKDTSTVEDEGYRGYLNYHSIFGRIDWPDFTVLASDKGNILIAAGLKLQHAANEKINQLLPQDAAAFLSGVVLGSRQVTSEKFSDSLKATGTNHLIVASGYNISILIAMVIKINKYLSKNLTTILVLVLIACYVLVSGLDPSIIRASIMASLGLIGTLFGRQKQAIYLTILAGFIMLLINPMWAYDVGFQLSFAATFGIITLQPYFFSKLARFPNFIREALSTTVAAQVFVYPILIITFGTISIISLATNMIVIWVIPIIMFGGMIVLLLSFVAYPLARLGAIAIYPLLLYVKTCITLTANIPYASIAVPGISWLTAPAYYAFIYCLYRISEVYEANSST